MEDGTGLYFENDILKYSGFYCIGLSISSKPKKEENFKTFLAGNSRGYCESEGFIDGQEE